MRPNGFHNHRQWIRPDLRQVCFTSQADCERELFRRWNELGIDARAITARIYTVPTHSRKQNGVKSVKTETTAFAVHAESLIAETSSETVRTQ